MKLMPDCDENIALHYDMPKKSTDKHNRWRHLRGPSTLWILMA